MRKWGAVSQTDNGQGGILKGVSGIAGYNLKLPAPVTGNGAFMERLLLHLEAVKVWRATAPVMGTPFSVGWTVSVEGMVVPASIRTVPVKRPDRCRAG